MSSLKVPSSLRSMIYDEILCHYLAVTKKFIKPGPATFECSRKPSSFSRTLRLDIGGHKIVLVSGTASVNEEGKPEHIGDFKAQLWRTYVNITNLLSAEDMTWHDVVRTTNYLRDIERDYTEFNKIRTSFYQWLNLNPLPASTGIQARLCWETLLVEIEVYAICKSS